MRIEKKQLKNFLIDSGLISEKDIDAAFKKADDLHQRPGDVLVSMGKISPQDLGRLYGYILGIPFINLEGEKVTPEVLQIIPEPVARSHNVVAYKKTGKDLEVAMLDPEDLETIEFIKKKSGLHIKARLTNDTSMRYLLSLYQKSLEAEFGEIIKDESELLVSSSEILKGAEGVVEGEEDLRKVAEELPIIKIVDTLIRHAILQKASDIHVEPLENELIVRYRIDGILHDAMVLPKKIASAVIARIKVLSGLKLDEKRLPQDGRFKVETSEYKFSMRVSVLPVYDGEKCVMRLLPENSKGFTLEVLGFHGPALEQLHEHVKRSTGMILATGPTGSGKTTTLYTLLDLINTPEINISTVEDPVEYRMPRINQTQVRPDIGFTFANGLRSLLRQDPDVIMVGEIRDNETATLAINAALTGHLVVSTLHTNSAGGTLPRLTDLDVEPFLIASTVNVIIAQRLVRTLYKSRKEHKLTKDEIASLEKAVNVERVMDYLRREKIVPPKAKLEDVTFYQPVPDQDSPDGYSGRIGIHEVMVITPTVKELVMKNSNADEIEDQAKKDGMMTMLEDGIFKAAQGITTIEEVLRVTQE
ncbi:MAG: GspE/PulE family protein [bacterium]|nr:GspE/PulE family protein [bacterium]